MLLYCIKTNFYVSDFIQCIKCKFWDNKNKRCTYRDDKNTKRSK